MKKKKYKKSFTITLDDLGNKDGKELLKKMKGYRYKLKKIYNLLISEDMRILIFGGENRKILKLWEEFEYKNKILEITKDEGVIARMFLLFILKKEHTSQFVDLMKYWKNEQPLLLNTKATKDTFMNRRKYK